MAARKLKFKPKPVVGGAVRRPRDKGEIPELTSQEPNISQGPSLQKVTLHSDKKNSVADASDTDKETSAKRLKMDQTDNLLVPQTGCGNKISDPKNNSLMPHLVEASTNETSQNNISEKSDTQIGQSIDVDLNKQVSLELHVTPTGESSSKLVDSIYTQDSTGNELSSEKNVLTSTNISEESNLSSSSTDKKVIAKGAPRFGRLKIKPVLNNNISRKKNENSDNQTTDESIKPVVYPVAIIRTESVIKSVQSENKKSNIASEITESFSFLESEDCQLSVNPTETEDNESCRYTCRFEYINEDAKTSKRELNKLNKTNLSVSNNEKSNKEENATSSLNLITRPDEPNVNQSLKDHSEVTNIAQISSPTKVPLSPLKPSSKMLVPKPCPNLMDTGVRRLSFQGSDSEEDSKRNLLLLKHRKLGKRAVKEEKNVKNNKRKLSQGSTYSKLGQEALVKFNQKFGKVEAEQPPDKSKLTMLDLIFYNPRSNPMSVSTEQSKGRGKVEKIEVNASIKEALAEEKVDDVDEVEPPAAVPVPQLKVGPDGQIMLDPKSLVIETTEVKEKRAEMEKSGIVRDTGITRYNTYSKKKHSRKDWSSRETLQFYKALNTIGSDFMLMTKLFPNRTRHELKLKFKKEERTNMKLIDRAMTAPTDFDFTSLEEEIKQENDEIQRVAELKRIAIETARKERALKKEEKVFKNRQHEYPKLMKVKAAAFKNFEDSELEKMKLSKRRKAPKKRRKKAIKKKKLETLIVSSSSDEDEIIVDSDEAGLEESEMKLLEMIRRKTRFGLRKQYCQPKELKEYEEINETLKKKLAEIDSDVSDDGYTPNGVGDDLLFRSPARDPFPESLSQDRDGSQWSVEVSSSQSVEDTVLMRNVEGVSQLAELVSLDQNPTRDFLSLHAGAQEVRRPSEPIPTVLNRHLISESIQIIDQLTSSENLNENTASDKQKEDEDLSSQTEVEPRENLIIDSESRSLPSVLCELEDQYISVSSHRDSAKTSEINNQTSLVSEEACEQHNMEKGNQQDIVLSHHSNNSEECILGN